MCRFLYFSRTLHPLLRVRALKRRMYALAGKRADGFVAFFSVFKSKQAEGETGRNAAMAVSRLAPYSSLPLTGVFECRKNVCGRMSQENVLTSPTVFYVQGMLRGHCSNGRRQRAYRSLSLVLPA
jgi:hypothetical protein